MNSSDPLSNVLFNALVKRMSSKLTMVLVQQQFPPGGGLTYLSASLGSTSDLGHGVHRYLGRQDGREPVSSCELSAPGNNIYSLFWFVVVWFCNV